MAQTGIDLNLFKILSHKPYQKYTLEELAQTTNADPVLLGTPDCVQLYAVKYANEARSETHTLHGCVWYGAGERRRQLPSFDNHKQSVNFRY